jgi:hypothetical protein
MRLTRTPLAQRKMAKPVEFGAVDDWLGPAGHEHAPAEIVGDVYMIGLEGDHSARRGGRQPRPRTGADDDGVAI